MKSIGRLLDYLQKEEGEDGLRTFFDEMCLDSAELRKRLKAHGLLLKPRFDPKFVAAGQPMAGPRRHISAPVQAHIDRAPNQGYIRVQIVTVDNHRATVAGSQQTHGRSQSVKKEFKRMVKRNPKKKKKAVVALMRKLTIRMWHMVEQTQKTDVS